MSKLTYSIEISRPVAQVFAYLDNTDNLKQWIGGLIEVTPLTHDGARVGAQTRQVLEENGRRIEMLEEVLVYEPNRRVKIKGMTDLFDMAADYTLHPVGEGTRLDYQFEVKFKSPFLKLLAPIFARSGSKKFIEDFARLKAQIEAQ